MLGATEDGLGVGQDTTETVLQALGCELQKVTEDGYQVTLPSWRLDLEREIDLIEEIARVYGYNRFANTLPTFAGIVSETPDAQQGSSGSPDPARAGLERGFVQQLLLCY